MSIQIKPPLHLQRFGMNSRTYKYDRTILGDDGTRKAVGRPATVKVERQTAGNLQNPKSGSMPVKSDAQLHTSARDGIQWALCSK